jgi:hypothetical protein
MKEPRLPQSIRYANDPGAVARLQSQRRDPRFQRSGAIGVAELLFDVDAIERRVGSFPFSVLHLEGIER